MYKFLPPLEPSAVRVLAHPAPVDHGCPPASDRVILGPVHVSLDALCRKPLHHEEDLCVSSVHGHYPPFSRTHQVITMG